MAGASGEIGLTPYHSQAFKLSKTSSQTVRAAPCLGQDNEYVYKEVLGYSDDEISDFLAEGVITVETGEPMAGDLLPTAERLANKIKTYRTEAVNCAKEAVTRGLDLTLEQGLKLEAELGCSL